jgi:hypothetical protein
MGNPRSQRMRVGGNFALAKPTVGFPVCSSFNLLPLGHLPAKFCRTVGDFLSSIAEEIYHALKNQ